MTWTALTVSSTARGARGDQEEGEAKKPQILQDWDVDSNAWFGFSVKGHCWMTATSIKGTKAKKETSAKNSFHA